MSAPASRPASAPVRVPAGTTAGAAVREAGLPTSGPSAVVVVRDADGRLRDLAWAPDADVEVEPVGADTDDGRSVIRHSAAHVLAQAVQQLRPEAKLGIGPPITDGFYYDFDVDAPFTPDDLRSARVGHEEDHQGRAAVLPAPLRLARRRPQGAGRRAVQAGADRPQGRHRRRHRRGDGGRRGRADHLRQRARAHRRDRLVRPLPRPAPADHQVHPGVQADALARPPTGGAARRTRSCSGSTAPRGRAPRRWRRTWTGWPRPSAATTGASAPSWTCSPSRTRSAPGWRSSTRRAG